MEDTENIAPAQGVDLTNCDREPIHIPGRIQNFGALLSLSKDWTIIRSSQNAPDFLGLQTTSLLGEDFTRLVDTGMIHDIRSNLQMIAGSDSVARIFGTRLNHSSDSLFDLAIHSSNGELVLEFEKHDADRHRDYTSHIRPLLVRLGRAKDLVGLCDLAVRQVRILTGFDRVMMYRFAEDGTGEVIAETKAPHMSAYLGLRYPGSDIPRQARALYKRNLLRIIADADHDGVDIVSAKDAPDGPLDLSLSTTRAVSPIHLQYLRNMEVGASMSISVIVRGELWGLIACHHDTPRTVSFPLRTTAELFSQLFSLQLDQQQSEHEREDDLRARILHDQIIAEMSEQASPEDNIGQALKIVRPILPHDGAVYWKRGVFASWGEAPSRGQITALLPLLEKRMDRSVFATDRAPEVFAEADIDFASCTGLLAVPAGRTSDEMLVLTRQEIVQKVRWAGNPDKPVEGSPDRGILTPRNSFEEWKEEVRGQSAPWSDAELRAAAALRAALIEAALRIADARYHQNERSSEQQELLIAELNHRVRNILNLIKGLISQSRDEALSVSGFTEIVGGRVHALARAHDLITRENWSPASLTGLVEAEAAAYLSGNPNRIEILGPDPWLVPKAFSTMSLVFHELMTNSAKYGALSDSSGMVRITFSQNADGSLGIVWLELDGPTVAPPTRRGFGSTIIERSIPYELGGNAVLDYHATGVEAAFIIPAEHVNSFQATADRNRGQGAQERASLVAPEAVLVVEDNMIIALDAEAHLQELGARQIEIASSVSAAIALIEAMDFDFVLLDVNLGAETSEKVARLLTEKRIPLIFTTGYGDLHELEDGYDGVPVVQKPYDADAIAEAMLRMKTG